MANDPSSTGEEQQQRLLNIWKETMEPWRDIRATMPLQYLYTFALVATKEGLGVQEYADLAGVAQTVMSRHLLDLGSRNRHMEPGFKLVESRSSPHKLRKSEIYLTPKGRNLARRLAEIMARATAAATEGK
jgi:DNA-binding MarR family transcriptional regulator